MRIRTTPGYSDLFGGTANLHDLLASIPSKTAITVLSWLNAQFLSTATPLDRDQEMRAALTEALSPDEIALLGSRLLKCAGPQGTVFHSVYLTYLLHYELTHFRSLPERDLEASDRLRIFKAYLVVVDLYSQCETIPDVDVAISDHAYFTQKIWPMLFKQHEFNRNVDPILTLTRLYLLMDTLEKSKHACFAEAYYKRFGCSNGFHLVRMFASVIRVSNQSNDGKNRVHRIDNAAMETRPLLDSLSHPVSSESTPWMPISLKSLKQFPLYKAKEGQYHILNWNFFYRSVYEAILRDFYHTSGIVSVVKSPVDFKQWVGFEVTEKRLFRAILKMMYMSNPEWVVFPSDKEEGKPDAYLRHGRYVVMLECKDTDVSESNQSEFEYEAFLAELHKKHVVNDKGKGRTVHQLARNAAMIMNEEYPKELYAMHRAKDLWVLPVLVCDGYLYTAPGMNEILNGYYESARKTRTGRLTVFTIEYLFRKISDFQPRGLATPLLEYTSECSRRKKRFTKAPSAELALETYPSLEEAVGIHQIPYKGNSGFLEEFYKILGLPTGREALSGASAHARASGLT